MENEPKSDRRLTVKLQWDDPAKVRTWLNLLREDILNALAAGEDATRPFKQRVLSRAEARRKLDDAESNIEKLLEAAERSLPPESETT